MRRNLELIDYPGHVVNVERMVSTLGGIKRISQVFSGEEKHLELRFHPKNPYNKSAVSDTLTHCGFLISVKVRRSKRNRSQPPTYEMNILGHCQKSFTFPNLCDFQYLPLYKTPNSQSLNFNLNYFLPNSATDIDFFGCSSTPLFCQPQVFARTDSLQTGLFRTDPSEDGQSDILGAMQKCIQDNRDVVIFNMIDSFPSHPDSQLTKRMKVKYVSDAELQTVKELFEKCPIWTRLALMYESGVSNEKLKCIIPYLAYFFSTGPWRTLYVRYGYDPRKDFQSRHYQTFDFRLRFRSGVADFVSNRKDTIKRKQGNPCDINELSQDINYPYLDEHKLPRSRQCILRYCDIHIPKVQEMLDKIPSPHTGAVCNGRTGWLPLGFDFEVRQTVYSAVKNVLRNHCRKEQVTAELDSMEDYGEEQQQDCDEDDLEEEELDLNDSAEYFDDNGFLSQTICEDLQNN